MKQFNINKLILKTAFITFLSVVGVAFLSGVILTFFSPVTLARWSSSLGLDNVSLYYYQKSFNKSNDVNDLYNYLNKAISVNNDEKVIESFELIFYEEYDYDNFVNYVNNFNLNSTDNFNLKLYVSNEDARLKSRYVTALLNQQNFNTALKFVVDDFYSDSIVSAPYKFNFLINTYYKYLLNMNAESQFYTQLENYSYNEQTINLLDQSVYYFNNLVNSLNTLQAEYVEPTESQKLQMALMASKVVSIANTFISLEDYFNSYVNLEDVLTTKINMINLLNNLMT